MKKVNIKELARFLENNQETRPKIKARELSGDFIGISINMLCLRFEGCVFNECRFIDCDLRGVEFVNCIGQPEFVNCVLLSTI